MGVSDLDKNNQKSSNIVAMSPWFGNCTCLRTVNFPGMLDIDHRATRRYPGALFSAFELHRVNGQRGRRKVPMRRERPWSKAHEEIPVSRVEGPLLRQVISGLDRQGCQGLIATLKLHARPSHCSPWAFETPLLVPDLFPL